MEYLKKFGKNLKNIRSLKGLSQEELAERSGLHRTYISFLERGQRNPTLTTIYKLASVLDINVRTFFEEVE